MLTCTIVDSASAIRPEIWTQLVGDRVEGFHFFQTLEAARLSDFTFHYAVVSQDGKPVLLAPLFTADFNLGIAVDSGPLKNIIHGLRKIFPRLLIMKTLFCGSPFGENGFVGILPDEAKNPDVIRTLFLALDTFCAQKGVPLIMFKDFLEENQPLLRPLLREGFFETPSFPNVSLALPFKSIEEYLRALSYHTRKELRRKIKKALAFEPIDVKVVNDVAPIIDQLYTLYLNTYRAGTVRFEKLTKDFFLEICRHLPGQAKYFLYTINNRLVAFNLCLLDGDTLIDKFIGLDYALARQYNLYFYTWYYNIEWCLNNGVRHYQVGQTDYGPKLHLGGELVPLLVLLRHRDAFLNQIFRQLAKFFSPASTDELLKDLNDQ
jgi:uncharacterized protein